MGKRAGCLVIDADGHVIERPEMWTRYVDAEFRDRAPRFVQDENGAAAQRIGDGLTGRLAVEMSSRVERASMDEIAARTGGWDPAVRLTDMDGESIDIAVLFPSMSFFVCEVADAQLDAALCRAYNTWLSDYCATAPDRLYGVALLPLQDVSAAVRELERCVDGYGFRGAFFRPNPGAPSRPPRCACPRPARRLLRAGGRPP